MCSKQAELAHDGFIERLSDANSHTFWQKGLGTTRWKSKNFIHGLDAEHQFPAALAHDLSTQHLPTNIGLRSIPHTKPVGGGIGMRARFISL